MSPVSTDSKSIIIEFCVDEKSTNQRLDKALSVLPQVGSRNRAQYLIENNCVLLNNQIPKCSSKVYLNDQIKIHLISIQSEELVPLNLKLDIVFEDEDLIVVNKPSGLVIHPAAGHSQDTLVNALIAHTKDLSMKFGEDRPGIVHRLDKETSGLLVVAKNDFSHGALAKQFQNRTIHRIYYAVGIGRPKKMTDRIISFLARHPVDRKKYSSLKNIKSNLNIGSLPNEVSNSGINPIGKRAITNYEVLKSENGLIYFRLKLETGRTHQIRIHLSELGHPILGDKLYGALNKYNQITSKEVLSDIKELERFLLHAAELGFYHPKTNEWMQFEIDWPLEIKKLLLKWNIL